MHSVLSVLAQQGGGGPLSMIVMMGLFFAVFYFIMFRPQQKRAKEHANMLAQLKKGDTVVTKGGMIGKISGVQDNVLTLEVQEKVRIRVIRSYVEGRHQESPGKTTEAAKTETTPSELKS